MEDRKESIANFKSVDSNDFQGERLEVNRINQSCYWVMNLLRRVVVINYVDSDVKNAAKAVDLNK